MNKSDQLYSQLLYILHQNVFTELDAISENSSINEEIKKIRQMIDMIEMLKEKTNGNLSPELSHIQSLMLDELESVFKKKFSKFMSNEPTRE
ncbi:MAG: DUF1844 domain-containing protein [Flavobacteriales bacterium]